MYQLVHHSEVCQSTHLEFVDLIVDHVIHLRVETSWEALLGGELIDARVDQCVLGLVVGAVGIVGVVITVVSTLSGSVVLELLEVVSQSHDD
jgi:hypothetical protein